MFNPDGALPSLTKTTAIDSLNITFESWLQNNGFIVMRSFIGVAVLIPPQLLPGPPPPMFPSSALLSYVSEQTKLNLNSLSENM